jgi:hypothetical protein
MKLDKAEQILLISIIILGMLYIGMQCLPCNTEPRRHEYMKPNKEYMNGGVEEDTTRYDLENNAGDRINIGSTCADNAQFISSSLLPKSTDGISLNDSGFDLAPQKLTDINFMQIVGTDTINASLKNPNLQLRSDPCIERKNVSPWLNSTIECDPLRKPLE